MCNACWPAGIEKTGGNSKYSFNNWEDLHLFQWFPITIFCLWAVYDWRQSAHPPVEFLSDCGFEWHKKALVSAGEFIWSGWGWTFVWLLSNLFLPIVTFAADHLTCSFACFPKEIRSNDNSEYVYGFICSAVLFSSTSEILGHMYQIWQRVEISKGFYSK